MSKTYTEEDIEELHSHLIQKLDELKSERPPDGKIPSYRFFDAVDDAFNDSPVDHPREN